MEKELKLILITIKNMLKEIELDRKREESNFSVLKKHISDLEQSMRHV
jgi:hypothetical protein